MEREILIWAAVVAAIVIVGVLFGLVRAAIELGRCMEEEGSKPKGRIAEGMGIRYMESQADGRE